VAQYEEGRCKGKHRCHTAVHNTALAARARAPRTHTRTTQRGCERASCVETCPPKKIKGFPSGVLHAVG